MAVKELFPSAQVTIGPVIEDGFFYDFAFERSFTMDDLAKIEKRMEELAAKDTPVVRSVMSRPEASNYLKAWANNTKLKLLAVFPAKKIYRFINKMILLTYVVAPMCHHSAS